MKVAHILRDDGDRSALVGTSELSGINASALARFDEVLLDHPDHPEDGQHHFAHDVAAVENDFGIVDLEDRSLGDDALGDGQQVAGISGQSIRVQGKQDVAGFEQADGGFELIA